MAESLCGPAAASVLDGIARLPQGSKIAAVSFGATDASGGRLAGALVLRAVCCLNRMRTPPAQVVVVPDHVGTREGYLSFRISATEMRGLMNAWRLRAAAAGESPGNHSAAEQSLIRRAKRRSDGPVVAAKAENLHLFFPAYRILDDNLLAPVASRDHLRTDDAPPSVTFVAPSTPPADLAEWGVSPEWVIVDIASAGRVNVEAIATWLDAFPRARHICLLPGLSHSLVDQLRGRGFRLAWLRDSAALGAPEPHLTFRRVRSSAEPADLKRLLELTSSARRNITRGEGPTEWLVYDTLRSAIHAITSLPVRRTYYDQAAVTRFAVPTTDELLSSLSRSAVRLAVTHPALAADVDEARNILTHVASQSDAGGDRERQLFTAVEDAFQNGTELCVVVRNRTVRTAVEAYLGEALNADLGDLHGSGIRIEARRDLRARPAHSAAMLLWTGYGGMRDLDSVLHGSNSSVTLLVNEFEHELLGRDLKAWANRAVAAQQGTEAMGVALTGTKQLIATVGSLTTRLREQAPTSSLGPGALEEITRLFEDSLGWTSTPLGRSEPRSDIMRLARGVVLEDGSTSFFPEDALLTVFRSAADEPIDVTVTELLPGDRIVFVDMTIGRTIYELMQEELGRSPLVGAAAQMVALWHRAIAAAGLRCKKAPKDILAGMRERGSSITTAQTIRTWLRGGVLGPRDIADVDRFAAVLGIGQRDSAVLDEIKASIQSLRNVYRQFARMVYRTILTGGTGRGLSESEQALVDAHGISLRDLREAITTETVVRVAQTSALRAADEIGRRVA